MRRKRKATTFSDTVHGSMIQNFNKWLTLADECDYEIISITPLKENRILVLYTYINKEEKI